MTIKLHFKNWEGEETEAIGAPGQSLLEAGQAIGLPLEGTCEGQMACSTCHVIVDEQWFKKLSPASEEEEDMLDFAAGVCRTSRLSCQITLSEDLSGLSVIIPQEAYDMQRI